MGVFQDCLDNAKTFKSTDPIARFLTSKIAGQIDPGVSTAAEAKDAVHVLAVSTQTSGNMTLTFSLRSGESFTTGSILFSATAATVEGIIDTAATSASITGWTNGDISVSGTAVNSGGLTFTFDGSSVSGTNHTITALTDVDGAGGAWGAITRSTVGQTRRYALDVLIALAVLDDGTIPEQSSAVSNSAVAAGANVNKFPQWALRSLAREMAEEDSNNDTYHSVIESLSIQDKARLAQRIGNSSEI